MRGTLALTLLLAACSGNTVSFPGTDTRQLFPFDGDRTWVYQSTDTTIPFLLDAEMLEGSEEIDGRNVYTINYFKDCVRDDPSCTEGDLFFALRLSNVDPGGIYIHGYDPGDGNVDLDPAILVLEDEARTQDVNETTTAGIAFESEYLGQGLCGELIVINTEWDCHGVEIRGDVDLFPVTGTIQAVAGQGIVNFAFSGAADQWKLLSSTQDNADGVW